MKRVISVSICLAALFLLAGCSYDVRLGQTDSGSVVRFTGSGQKTYGITVTRADGDILQQLAPAKLYLCADGKTLSEFDYPSFLGLCIIVPGMGRADVSAVDMGR